MKIFKLKKRKKGFCSVCHCYKNNLIIAYYREFKMKGVFGETGYFSKDIVCNECRNKIENQNKFHLIREYLELEEEILVNKNKLRMLKEYG